VVAAQRFVAEGVPERGREMGMSARATTTRTGEGERRGKGALERRRYERGERVTAPPYIMSATLSATASLLKVGSTRYLAWKARFLRVPYENLECDQLTDNHQLFKNACYKKFRDLKSP